MGAGLTMRALLSNRFIYWIVAAVALGIALQINDGLFDPEALALLLVTIWAVAMARFAPLRTVAQCSALGALLAGALLVIGAGFFRSAGGRYRYFVDAGPQWPYQCGLAAAAAGILVVYLRPRWARLGAVWLLLIFCTVGVWKIRENSHPFIDVYDFQTDGPEALLRGVDPYTITFRNIYGPNTPVYGPGVATADRLLFGYPYMPLVMYWIAPAQWLLQDFRYAQVLALALAGGIVCVSAPGPVGVMAAALLLFSPRIFYVIESGWTEPLSILLLSLTAWCRLRDSRWTTLWFGLLLASKQYMPITLLLAPTLVYQTHRRTSLRKVFGMIWKPLAIAAVISAPLVLWNLPAFIHSAVTLQLHQPFRDDSLSLLVPIARMWRPSNALAALAFLAAGLSGLLSGLGIAPRRSAFAGAAAAQFLCFFALNKQAFSNYYALVIAAVVLALVEEFVQNRENPVDTELSDHAPSRPADHSPAPRDAAAGAAG